MIYHFLFFAFPFLSFYTKINAKKSLLPIPNISLAFMQLNSLDQWTKKSIEYCSKYIKYNLILFFCRYTKKTKKNEKCLKALAKTKILQVNERIHKTTNTHVMVFHISFASNEFRNRFWQLHITSKNKSIVKHRIFYNFLLVCNFRN